MAKVKLNKMFVTSVTGTAGTASWKTGASNYALVKQAGGQVKRRRTLRIHRRNPLLVLPATMYADCDAWKLADATYTAMPELYKREWRFNNHKPGTSGYDVYMRSAIPHLLRGYPAPDHPPASCGWRLQKLQRPLTYFVTGQEAGCTALPPPSCITHGLHFAGMAWRKVTMPQYPAWGTFYCCRLLIGFDTGNPRIGKEYFCGITAMEDPRKPENRWISDLLYPEEHLPQFFSTVRPWYIRLEVYPWKTYMSEEKGTVPPYLIYVVERGLEEPDLTKQVVVEFLNPAENFVHWKRWWPSRKRDSIPEDLSYLTDWPDEPPLHYWPKEYR
jgi:hypothetical protein